MLEKAEFILKSNKETRGLMSETHKIADEVVTKVEPGKTKNGKDCLSVFFAGKRFPDNINLSNFTVDVRKVFEEGGSGTYKISRAPNEYNGKTYWNIIAASKLGNASPVIAKKAEVQQSKTGDDIRRAVAFKGAIDILSRRSDPSEMFTPEMVSRAGETHRRFRGHPKEREEA